MAATATKKLTLEEYARLPDDGVRRELDEGELIEMTFPRSRHTITALNLYDRLNPWVRSQGMGRCFMDAGFLMQDEPAVLRGPDVAFVRSDRLANMDLDDWIEGAPELAVEVVSPSEGAQDLHRKVHQYLEHGVVVVATIYPRERSVHVHRRAETILALGPADTLEIPDLFPGWSMPVADLF